MRWSVHVAGVVGVTLVGCFKPAPGAAPELSALLVAGDSTYWVVTEGDDVRLRRSPMLVTQLDGRLHELYVTDEDLTHEGALLVGQRVFRRDLVSGDSVVVRYDTSIVRIAERWLDRHPGARRLAPDEDQVEEPSTQATTDVTLLDAVGPWLSYESRLDVDAEGEPHVHLTRRGVLDLRTGLPVLLHDLMTPGEVRRIVNTGRTQLAVAVDSIRSARDARAARARALMPSFTFDSSSFELVSAPFKPAIAFLVPGRGERAGGYALPLPDLPVASPAWSQLAATWRPSFSDSSAIAWTSGTYTVRVATSGAAGNALVEITRGERRWRLGEVPLPVRRLLVLPAPSRDSVLHRALRRAFDDAESGGLARPAGSLRTQARARLIPASSRNSWTPRLLATPKPSSPIS